MESYLLFQGMEGGGTHINDFYLELAPALHTLTQWKTSILTIMDIRENASLQEYTTFKLGGTSRYFVRVESLDDLLEAIQFAHSHNVPFFILGEGSNVLIRDEGFPGLTIWIKLLGKEVVDEKDRVLVRVSAGEVWDKFVEWAVEENLYGIENLSGIPGTVGAAPIQNIGAYGTEVKEVIDSVEVFDSNTMKTKTLSKKECGFTYRDSIFKHIGGKHFIVVSVTFVLKKHAPLRTSYKDIDRYFKENNGVEQNLKTLRQAVLLIRSHKFPDLSAIGTAGSFFKNPIISNEEFKVVKQKYPDIPYYVLENGTVKLPLAWILEHVCDMKGVRSGNVGTFEKQPLVLVHYGGGSTKEMEQFASRIQHNIKEKINIKIIPEVTYI